MSSTDLTEQDRRALKHMLRDHRMRNSYEFCAYPNEGTLSRCPEHIRKQIESVTDLLFNYEEALGYLDGYLEEIGIEISLQEHRSDLVDRLKEIKDHLDRTDAKRVALCSGRKSFAELMERFRDNKEPLA